MPQANNDLSSLIGLLSVIGVPILSLLLSQKAVVKVITRIMLWVVNRLAQDRVTHTSPLPDHLNGNGSLAIQSTLQTQTEISKRVDGVKDDLDEFKENISAVVDDFYQKWRVRSDSDLINSTRKFKALSEELEHQRQQINSHDTRLSELEDWRGAK